MKYRFGQSVAVILPLKSFVASLTCLILSAKNLGPDTLKTFLSLWLIASFEAAVLSFKFFLRPATVLRDLALVSFWFCDFCTITPLCFSPICKMSCIFLSQLNMTKRRHVSLALGVRKPKNESN